MKNQTVLGTSLSPGKGGKIDAEQCLKRGGKRKIKSSPQGRIDYFVTIP